MFKNTKLREKNTKLREKLKEKSLKRREQIRYFVGLKKERQEYEPMIALSST